MHTHTSLLVHVVFSTKDRRPSISPELADRLFPYMGGIVRERKGVPLIINGVSDHVHLLVSVAASDSVAELAARTEVQFLPSHQESVRSYIADQETRHRKVSYRDEFLALLKRHGLACGREDVWE